MNGHAAFNAAQFDLRDFDREFPAQRHRAQLIADLIRPLGPFPLGADVGCFGCVASAIYRSAGIETLHGFDLAPSSLAACATRGVTATRWDFSKEPFPGAAGSYDVLIASEVIEHVDDTESALRGFRSALRRGGLLVLTTPNLAFWYSRVRLLSGRAPHGAPGVAPGRAIDPALDPLHARIGTLEEWRALVETCGFSVCQVSATSYLQAETYPRKWIARLDRLIARRPTLGGNLVILARAA